MGMNQPRFERRSAQGRPVFVLGVTGPDVVGDARVYMTLDGARAFAAHVSEEITLAEMGNAGCENG